VIAIVCILIYIWFRFRDISFAASAVIALLHDVLIVLTFYVFSRTSVGGTFIACMLTIVGYSINATIVIFDRIRSGLKTSGERVDYRQLVNESITCTLSRSINTSLTTFIMLLALYIFGVASIREFALPLMVGIIAGGYSSVFVTGSLWLVIRNAREKHQAVKAKKDAEKAVEARKAEVKNLSNSKKKKSEKREEKAD
jgi:SecD/SecF fusion protein